METEELKALIETAVAENRTTYKAISQAIGRNETYIQQFVKKGVPRELRERDARAIVEMLGGTYKDPAPMAPAGFVPKIVPGRELVGDKNFPIYAAARGSSEGHQIVTFEAIDYVKRPTILESVKDAYGLYIVGESMIPAFEPGDMALVHPHLPPARDKNVVLYHVPPFTEAEAEAMVKRLLRYDDRDWHLRQFNPGEGEERDFSVSRADWKFCHRIVGKYEAR